MPARLPAARRMSPDSYATAFVVVAIAFSACLMPAQTDTWWQLRTGEHIWRAGEVVLQDEFTHTVSGQHWPNHEWLSQVLFFGAYSVGGMPLLTALCAAAVAFGWLIVAALTKAPPILKIALLGALATVSSVAWSVRPQTLTFAMFAATLWILVNARFVWALPFLFLVWANLHGAVALGGMLVLAALAAAAVTDRRALPKLFVVAAACLLATALTPLGVSLWMELPKSLARLQAYGVNEWRAPELTELHDLPFWAIAAVTCGLIVARREQLRTRGTLTLAVASVMLLLTAVRTRRNIPPFVVCAAPTIAALLALRPSRDGRMQLRHAAVNRLVLAALLAAGVSIVGHAWSKPLPRLGWKPMSAELAAAIRRCPGPLYNRYDEGGYLIWFLPERKVFIDSRQDPFPEELVLEHIQLERSGDYWRLFERYGVECALTPQGSPLAERLLQDGWQADPAGPGWQVYRRVPASGARITKVVQRSQP